MRRLVKHEGQPYARLAHSRSASMAYVYPGKSGEAFANRLADKIGSGDRKTGELVIVVGSHDGNGFFAGVYPRQDISPDVLKAYLNSRLGASLYYDPALTGRDATVSMKLRANALR